MNKIKLIDIKNNPLELTEEIILDIVNNDGKKYMNLFSTMLNIAVHMENEIRDDLTVKIIKYDRLVPIIESDIYNNSDMFLISRSNLLNYRLDNSKLNSSTENTKFIHDIFNFNLNNGILAYEEYLQNKYQFNLNTVYDAKKEVLDAIGFKGTSNSNMRYIKFIYIVIMIFLKNSTIKSVLNSLSYSITNNDVIHQNEKHLLPIINGWLFEINLLRGYVCDFNIFRNKVDSKNGLQFGQNFIQSFLTNNTSFGIHYNGLIEFKYIDCFYLDLDNTDLDKTIFVDMEYINNKLYELYWNQLNVYRRVNRSVFDRPVTSNRLKSCMFNMLYKEIKFNKYEYMCGLLTFSLKEFYIPDKWYKLITKYKDNFLYYHDLKQKVFIKNISTSIKPEDLDYVYGIIDDINLAIDSKVVNNDDGNVIDRFIIEATSKMLSIEYKDDEVYIGNIIQPILFTNEDILTLCDFTTDKYIYNVIRNKGNWNIDPNNCKCDVKDSTIKYYIFNTIKNLLEFQSRKTLFKVLVNAMRYINESMELDHHPVYKFSSEHYKTISKLVNKVRYDNKIIFDSTKLKNEPEIAEMFRALNDYDYEISINLKENKFSDYTNLRSYQGRYKDMGDLYLAIKDVLYLYFVALIIEEHKSINPEELLSGLRVNKSVVDICRAENPQINNNTDNINKNDNIDMLNDLWNKQLEFDKMTFNRNKTSRNETRRDRYLALMVELGEILKEDECYKYWKSTRHTLDNKEYRTKAKEEFADLLHFVMSIGIDIYDGGVKEMYEYYLNKNKINIERQANKY